MSRDVECGIWWRLRHTWSLRTSDQGRCRPRPPPVVAWKQREPGRLGFLGTPLLIISGQEPFLTDSLGKWTMKDTQPLKRKNTYCPYCPLYAKIMFLETRQSNYLQMAAEDGLFQAGFHRDQGRPGQGPRSQASRKEVSLSGPLGEMPLVCACLFPAHLTTGQSSIWTLSCGHNSLWRDTRICQALTWLRDSHMLFLVFWFCVCLKFLLWNNYRFTRHCKKNPTGSPCVLFSSYWI